MSWSSKSIDFITLFTEDLERSKAFYQDVFGLRLIFEDENSAVFRFANTGINLLRSEAAGELVSPGAVASRNAGARLVFTISMNDVYAVCAELTGHGVELLNGPVNRPWGVRTASFTDPGGHIWEIASPISLRRTWISSGQAPAPGHTLVRSTVRSGPARQRFWLPREHRASPAPGEDGAV